MIAITDGRGMKQQIGIREDTAAETTESANIETVAVAVDPEQK